MEKYNFPESFTNTVRSLYHDAETAVMINGVLSSKFKVIRGVRQGDPLSCLLFDVAIEPRIVVTMFADDTTVYLTAQDDMETLNKILRCNRNERFPNKTANNKNAKPSSPSNPKQHKHSSRRESHAYTWRKQNEELYMG